MLQGAGEEHQTFVDSPTTISSRLKETRILVGPAVEGRRPDLSKTALRKFAVIPNRTLLSSFLAALFTASAFGADLSELRVAPPGISLTTNRDLQSIVVQAVYADGVTRDVTDQASWTLADESLVTRENNVFRPAADGETQLTVGFEGQSVAIPVKVEKAAEARPISFKLDVMPVFMKAGCNTGSCHGAARGKDGFRLSLFGFDADGDHFRITRELPGRRIDLAVPEASLLVEKAVGAVPHTGGKRFALDSEECGLLVEWISNNVPQDPADVPSCTSLDIYPKQAVLDGEGETQRVTVRAGYSDGTVRDVTKLALFLTSNENSAAISEEGVVTAGARGEAFVMARFATHTVGSQYIVLPKGLQYQRRPFEPVNYIDELIADKLNKLRIHPSGQCSDEEFLRRVNIDLVGLLPTVEEYTAFIESDDPDKRTAKIDELIARKEFTELWVSKWAEWLMMRSSNRVSYKSIVLYYQWLSEQIADNVPLNVMVQDLLSANGGTFKVPQTNFYQIETDRLKVAENVAQTFMGMRIQCAQCHNHPFDRWTQDDYYNFAAFFAQIGRKRGEDSRETIVFNSGGGEVKHVVTGQNAPPVFLGGGKPEMQPGEDRREILAKWLASPENPYFAANFVNRVWQHFFGIGIVDPVDDVRISNPASNPELLETMARKLTETNYDFKALVRDICLSKTYQRSTQRNESNASDEMNFAHQNIRRIKAESVLDVISQVTNTKDKFRGLPLGARAVQIADGATSDYFLTTFGRAKRETACSCEVKMEPTLSQALHLLNGNTANGKIQQGGVIAGLNEQYAVPAKAQALAALQKAAADRRTAAEQAATASNTAAEEAKQTAAAKAAADKALADATAAKTAADKALADATTAKDAAEKDVSAKADALKSAGDVAEAVKAAQEALDAAKAAQEKASQTLAAAQKSADAADAALKAAQKTATDAAAADKAAQQKAATLKAAADKAVDAAKVTPEQQKALESARGDLAAAQQKTLENLYIRTLTRRPTDAEREALAPLFAEGSNVEQSQVDVFWALLNSREFLFNH